MSVEKNANVDPPVRASTTSIAPSQVGLAATSAYAVRGVKMTPRSRAGKLFAAAAGAAGATACGISGLVFSHQKEYGRSHFRFRRRPADADPADVANTFRSTPRPPWS